MELQPSPPLGVPSTLTKSSPRTLPMNGTGSIFDPIFTSLEELQRKNPTSMREFAELLLTKYADALIGDGGSGGWRFTSKVESKHSSEEAPMAVSLVFDCCHEADMPAEIEQYNGTSDICRGVNTDLPEEFLESNATCAALGSELAAVQKAVENGQAVDDDACAINVLALTAAIRTVVLEQVPDSESLLRHAVIVNVATHLFSAVYGEVLEKAKAVDPDGLKELATICAEIEAVAKTDERTQSETENMSALYKGAIQTKNGHFDALLSRMSSEQEGCHEEVPGTLKRMYRVLEKGVQRKENNTNGEFTLDISFACDLVRGMLVCRSFKVVAAILEALLALHKSGKIVIVNLKNRFDVPSPGGWADAMVNFYFVGDDLRHICEIQVVHEDLLLARSGLGGHKIYNKCRNAAEVLEFGVAISPANEELVLMCDLFVGLHGSTWLDPEHRRGWLETADLSEWAGVRVGGSWEAAGVEGRVVELDLSRRDIRALPDPIGQLSSLKTLNLQGNKLTGAIYFQCICSTSKTFVLRLTPCLILSELPESIGDLSALESLDVNENELSGRIYFWCICSTAPPPPPDNQLTS
jgi:hypothetical protein